MSYETFLAGKLQHGADSGFEPEYMPDFLFDFQRHLTEWAIRKGRAAIFADCGLGKTPMQLTWAENVVRKTGKPVLDLTPLAVGAQTVREASKFGIEAAQSRDGRHASRVVVTNYERIQHFDPSDFGGVVCDESSALKAFNTKRTEQVTEFVRTVPYRLLCTATAAPNDYLELGNSSEALGWLGFRDMLTRFFRKAASKSRAWGHATFELRGHASRDFWRWVCSWARAVRRPSDLGFSDRDFRLPDLITNEHVIETKSSRPGLIFDLPAVTLEEQREERKRTLKERCEKAAELVADTGRPFVNWCHLNAESKLLSKLIPDAVEVTGGEPDEAKEEKFLAFERGEIRGLVTKTSIAGFGMNWQHCAHMTTFPSHSFEQYYQGVRRFWRFGQKSRVCVDMITTEGESGVLANLRRKADAADALFDRLVELMHDQLDVMIDRRFNESVAQPAWLGRTV